MFYSAALSLTYLHKHKLSVHGRKRSTHHKTTVFSNKKKRMAKLAEKKRSHTCPEIIPFFNSEIMLQQIYVYVRYVHTTHTLVWYNAQYFEILQVRQGWHCPCERNLELFSALSGMTILSPHTWVHDIRLGAALRDYFSKMNMPDTRTVLCFSMYLWAWYISVSN